MNSPEGGRKGRSGLSFEVDRILAPALTDLDLDLRGTGIPIFQRHGLPGPLARPGDLDPVEPGDGAVALLEGGQHERPVGLYAAVGLATEVRGLKGDAPLDQGFALVGHL